MPAPTQLALDRFELGPHPFSDSDPPQPEPSAPVLATDVCQAQEIERLRLTQTPHATSFGREPSELDQPRLVRVQSQTGCPA